MRLRHFFSAVRSDRGPAALTQPDLFLAAAPCPAQCPEIMIADDVSQIFDFQKLVDALFDPSQTSPRTIK